MVDEVGTRDDPRFQGGSGCNEAAIPGDRDTIINSPVDLSFSRHFAGISFNAPLPEEVGYVHRVPLPDPWAEVATLGEDPGEPRAINSHVYPLPGEIG